MGLEKTYMGPEESGEGFSAQPLFAIRAIRAPGSLLGALGVQKRTHGAKLVSNMGSGAMEARYGPVSPDPFSPVPLWAGTVTDFKLRGRRIE